MLNDFLNLTMTTVSKSLMTLITLMKHNLEPLLSSQLGPANRYDFFKAQASHSKRYGTIRDLIFTKSSRANILKVVAQNLC